MGSRLTIAECAYLAGFLDGDGSLMFQLKQRNDGKRRWRFMVTICFYQDSRHDAPLRWIRRKLGIGYLSRRNDGITEVRINGFQKAREILTKLLPHLRFKKTQAEVIYRACDILARKNGVMLSRREKEFLLRCMMIVQKHNYASRRKKTLRELQAMIGLTP